MGPLGDLMPRAWGAVQNPHVHCGLDRQKNLYWRHGRRTRANDPYAEVSPTRHRIPEQVCFKNGLKRLPCRTAPVVRQRPPGDPYFREEGFSAAGCGHQKSGGDKQSLSGPCLGFLLTRKFFQIWGAFSRHLQVGGQEVEAAWSEASPTASGCPCTF
jgi:hypothetical protein